MVHAYYQLHYLHLHHLRRGRHEISPFLVEPIVPNDQSQVSVSARSPFLVEPIFRTGLHIDSSRPFGRFREVSHFIGSGNGSEKSSRPPADISKT